MRWIVRNLWNGLAGSGLVRRRELNWLVWVRFVIRPSSGLERSGAACRLGAERRGENRFGSSMEKSLAWIGRKRDGMSASLEPARCGMFRNVRSGRDLKWVGMARRGVDRRSEMGRDGLEWAVLRPGPERLGLSIGLDWYGSDRSGLSKWLGSSWLGESHGSEWNGSASR